MTAIKMIIHQHHNPHADDSFDDNNISLIILTIITIDRLIVFIDYYHFGSNDLIITKLIAQMQRTVDPSYLPPRQTAGWKSQEGQGARDTVMGFGTPG